MNDISRRKFITSAVLTGLATTMFSGLSFASAPTENRLIVVLLRGGMDSLSACVPYGDKNYYKLRGSLAIDKNSLLKIGNGFGLHPKLKNINDRYKQKEALIFNNVAVSYGSRSHFDMQNILENGLSAPYETDQGWLNRLIGELVDNDYQLGMAIGRKMPLIIDGKENVGSWSPQILPELDDNFIAKLRKMYKGDDLFSENLMQAINVSKKADEFDVMNKGDMNKTFSPKAFEVNAKMAAKWLSDPMGPRIATLELGGWDTHANQGRKVGQLANNLEILDNGINNIKEEMGDLWRKTSVLCLTEFGRTVRPNGTNGTDHGTGSIAMLFGGGINGGQMIGKWGGLDNLYDDRDLTPLMDVKSVIKSVISGVFGVSPARISSNILSSSLNLPFYRDLYI